MIRGMLEEQGGIPEGDNLEEIKEHLESLKGNLMMPKQKKVLSSLHRLKKLEELELVKSVILPKKNYDGDRDKGIAVRDYVSLLFKVPKTLDEFIDKSKKKNVKNIELIIGESDSFSSPIVMHLEEKYRIEISAKAKKVGNIVLKVFNLSKEDYDSYNKLLSKQENIRLSAYEYAVEIGEKLLDQNFSVNLGEYSLDDLKNEIHRYEGITN